MNNEIINEELTGSNETLDDNDDAHIPIIGTGSRPLEPSSPAVSVEESTTSSPEVRTPSSITSPESVPHWN